MVRVVGRNNNKSKWNNNFKNYNPDDNIVEMLFNTKKIKYTKLNEILMGRIPKNTEMVTIYMDVYSILNPLYNPNSVEEIKTYSAAQKYIVSSEIINIIAHYRHYFWSRWHLSTNFILYYNTEVCESAVMVNPEYKKEFYNKFITGSVEFGLLNRLFQSNMNLVKLILEYIPNAYLIDTKNVDCLFVPYYFFQDKAENEFSIIFTNDVVQSMNIIYNKDCLVITNKMMNINVYDYNEIFKFYMSDIAYSKNPLPFIQDLIPFAFAMSKQEIYNTTGINKYGLTKAILKIAKMIKSGIIENRDYDIETFIELISKCNDFINHPEYLDTIRANYKLLTPEYQCNVLPPSVKAELELNQVNLIDAESLQALNNKYYEYHPLHIEELMDGEEYI